jgi:cell division protein FtsQ
MTTQTLESTPSSEVDPRIQARRDEVERARQRRRRRWRFAIFGALTVVAAGWLVTRTAALDVDRVRVEGTVHTDAEELRAASGVVPGDPLLEVDEAAVRDRLRELPWVADAEVQVSWKGDVVLRITEREPVAMMRDRSGQPVLVDRDARVLQVASLPDATLVAIDGIVAGEPGETVGAPADDALAIVTAVTPGLRSRIEVLRVDRDGQFEFEVRPSGRVRFGGATDIEAKIGALQTAFAQVDDTHVEVIDVRVPEQVLIVRA